MKAARFHEFGGPDVMRVDEVGDPTPGPGELVVAIRGSALNHLDVDMRQGVSRFPLDLPHTLGYEVVGVVAEVGEGVEEWRVGDRVMPYVYWVDGTCRLCRTGRESLCLNRRFVQGGYAEAIVVPASHAMRIPDALSDVDAAALQTGFGTSWHMLFTRGDLRTGEIVLVNSVGSGIGSAAVQLAKRAGAFVIGTASGDEKLERARELGLDEGINYTRQDVVEEVRRITDGYGVDLVYEHVGGELFQKSLDSLALDGRLVTCGGHAGEVVPFDLIPIFRGQKTVRGSFGFSRVEVEKCLALAAAGHVTPVVYETFPLDETADAMRTLEGRGHFGKIILTP